MFGNSLSEADEHLVIPMRRWRDQAVAISIRPSDDEEGIIQAKAAYRSRLAPMSDVTFFDSTTQPLGAADLRVEEDE